MNPTPPNSPLLISYLVLRKAIGVIGISLPALLLFGALLIFKEGIQESISAYYHTDMGDVFVGALWAIGFFLFSYKGYEQPTFRSYRQDEIAGFLAFVFALGTSLFPTAPEGHSCKVERIYCVHGVFAALLFLTLTFFSLFLFTKTRGSPTPQKLMRNKVYKVSGYIMLAAILLVPVVYFLPDSVKAGIMPLNPVFWLEAIAVVAFGVSWLTKGEAILGDP